MFFSSLASAELYKCQTQDGRLGFSDRPCPTGSKEETVIVKKDKTGKTSILHPLRMMAKMDTELEMAVALLHDVIEDSDYTAKDLLWK